MGVSTFNIVTAVSLVFTGTVAIINFPAILVVLWMTCVIVIDRVIPACC